MMRAARIAGSGNRGIARGTKNRERTTIQKTIMSVVSFIEYLFLRNG
jgi:hypothetical protein